MADKRKFRIICTRRDVCVLTPVVRAMTSYNECGYIDEGIKICQ